MISEFEIFGRVFSAYQVAILVGIFAAGIWALQAASQRNIEENDMLVVLLVCGAGALLGGHLLYGITRLCHLPALLSASTVQDVFGMLGSLFGGSVFYGGLLGGGAICFLYLRKSRRSITVYTDILACSVPLFHFFGRIGCFLSGCCYGIPCEFGFLYPHAAIAGVSGVRRFPVQLLEAGINLLIFFLLRRLLKKKQHRGALLIYYLFAYPSARFFLEFLRGDEYRGFLLGLSTSQWISLFLLAGALTLYRKRVSQILDIPGEKR